MQFAAGLVIIALRQVVYTVTLYSAEMMSQRLVGTFTTKLCMQKWEYLFEVQVFG